MAAQGHGVTEWLTSDPARIPYHALGLSACSIDPYGGSTVEFQVLDPGDDGGPPQTHDAAELARWALDRMPQQVSDWSTLMRGASVQVNVEQG